MLLRLIVLFVFVPWLELFILFRLSEVAGFRAALALVLVTGVVGAALARREGIQALTRIRAALKRGEIPGRQMIDGVLILAAGLVLITPGMITDTVGFLLLIAPVRGVIREFLIRRFQGQFTIVSPLGRTGPTQAPAGGPTNSRSAVDDDVIDVTGRVVDDE